MIKYKFDSKNLFLLFVKINLHLLLSEIKIISTSRYIRKNN